MSSLHDAAGYVPWAAPPPRGREGEGGHTGEEEARQQEDGNTVRMGYSLQGMGATCEMC